MRHYVIILAVLIFADFPVLAQEATTALRSELLQLESEAKTFISFETKLISVSTQRYSRVLRHSELNDLQSEARDLLPLATELLSEARTLSGPLYTEPGVEITPGTLYRLSAWELGNYYAEWIAQLQRILNASVTSSPDTFYSMDMPSFEDARLYRILANQQRQIDEMWSNGRDSSDPSD